MDFTKYVSLLTTSSLFLSRIDLLGDPFEGSYSKANIRLRPSVYKNLEPKARENFINFTPKVAKWYRQWAYANCWHMNNYESAAMWKLYSKSNEAVAIQAIYSKVIEILPSDLFIGLVQYINYETEWLPEGYLLYPFMHKRNSFSHEKEVRIIKPEFPLENERLAIGKKNTLKGILIKINLEELLENIYVAPTAPEWYYDLVVDISAKYNIKNKIQYSKLDELPVF